MNVLTLLGGWRKHMKAGSIRRSCCGRLSIPCVTIPVFRAFYAGSLSRRRRPDVGPIKSLGRESDCAVIIFTFRDGAFPIENLLARNAVRRPGNRSKAVLRNRFFTM